MSSNRVRIKKGSKKQEKGVLSGGGGGEKRGGKLNPTTWEELGKGQEK